jgi:hypothetical protein
MTQQISLGMLFLDQMTASIIGNLCHRADM